MSVWCPCSDGFAYWLINGSRVVVLYVVALVYFVFWFDYTLNFAEETYDHKTSFSAITSVLHGRTVFTVRLFPEF